MTALGTPGTQLRRATLAANPLLQQVIKRLNLRPEELERTFLMFAFYTTTSAGLLWFESTITALFLEEYSAKGLPWIYIASAGIGSGLGFLYSWMQKVLPLRIVIVLIALIMAIPLLGFRIGMDFGNWTVFGKVTFLSVTVLLMRLWQEAIYVLNDLNASITANQLFNIREIKRTYPLISSGVLFADVFSGFSLDPMVSWLGLENVILAAFLMMVVGAVILFYLSDNYQQAFPDLIRRSGDEEASDFAARRLQGPLKSYGILLFAFFILAQVLFLFVDFQYLSQIEERFKGGEEIAKFLGRFSGFLGIVELLTQLFLSSWLIEWLGVFGSAMLLPIGMVVLGGFSWFNLFWGLICLKFLDELLRYTLVASVSPVLFQPLPDTIRSNIQSVVRGIAEPLSIGVTGGVMLVIIWLLQEVNLKVWQGRAFIVVIILLSGVWMGALWLLRSGYVDLLVQSAERGQLSNLKLDLPAIKRKVVETLERPGNDADKSACIELLSRFDPKNVGDVLAPLLPNLSPDLQRKSLEAMLLHPNVVYLPMVRSLINQPLQPRVLALALRYVWLTDPEPEINQLRPYLYQEVDPVVRGTAASLMLRRGNPRQKAEATEALRRMITHRREREREMGCRALGEAIYMQALRLYIPNLLQDRSLQVRCAILEAIAATQLDEYYPSLLRALHYKSTREAAMQALKRLENDAIPMLVEFANDRNRPDVAQMYAWQVVGEIGTLEALDALVSHLVTAWGAERRNLLRILVKLPQERGIDAVVDRLGRSGIENLFDQELSMYGQLCAALVDFSPDKVQCREADLLRDSLRMMQEDIIERVFLLLRFLYPVSAIQAASFSLRSESRSSMARGLEILDNTVDLVRKRALLSILDRRSDLEKLQTLADLVTYQPLDTSSRLRYLLDLRYFLSDWCLACCFHLARETRWSITAEQTLACLRHPASFVREAALAYVQIASPRSLPEFLQRMQRDPNPLVVDQVKQLMQNLKPDPG